MDTQMIRYVGRREGMIIKTFQSILRFVRRNTFEKQSALGEKKVIITISIEEIP